MSEDKKEINTDDAAASMIPVKNEEKVPAETKKEQSAAKPESGSEEKRKTKKFSIFKDRSYLNDFKMNDDGKYQYKGEKVRWKEERKKKLYWLGALALIQLTAHGSPGFMAQVKMEGHVFVVLPWAFALIGSLMQLWAIGRLYLAGDPLPTYIFKQTAEKLPIRSLISFILSAMTAIGEMISLIQNPSMFTGILFYPIFFIGLEMGAAACALTIYRNPVQLEEIRHKNQKQ